MMGILGWLVGTLLCAWFVVTVLASIPSLRGSLTRFDVIRLIPNWALFARPRTVDLILLRRDVLRDGTLTHWREVEIAGPRRWYNFIWHPGLGPRRGFLSLADQTARAAQRYRVPAWRRLGQGTASAIPDMTTVRYLAILKYVAERSHQSVDVTQFMVMTVTAQAISGRYDSTEPGSVVFVSELHFVRRPGRSKEGDQREHRDARLAV
jgi:hypothetical protein